MIFPVITKAFCAIFFYISKQFNIFFSSFYTVELHHGVKKIALREWIWWRVFIASSYKRFFSPSSISSFLSRKVFQTKELTDTQLICFSLPRRRRRLQLETHFSVVEKFRLVFVLSVLSEDAHHILSIDPLLELLLWRILSYGSFCLNFLRGPWLSTPLSC